jgi:hypothetical protein
MRSCLGLHIATPTCRSTLAEEKRDLYVLVDPKQPLPCSLGVVVRQSRIDQLGEIERSGEEHLFVVRAVLSHHIPLAGSMEEILARPSYRLLAVNEPTLTIYLHHGGRNATFFDLVGATPDLWVDSIDVNVRSRFPSNCFWAARSAVSYLLDTMVRVQVAAINDSSPGCKPKAFDMNRVTECGSMGLTARTTSWCLAAAWSCTARWSGSQANKFNLKFAARSFDALWFAAPKPQALRPGTAAFASAR